MSGQRFQVEPDVDVEYDIVGDGPEIVWLHGLSGCLEDGRPVVEHLAKRFRVLWYSTRGHGRSSPLVDRTRYGYGRIAADLDALLDHVGFTRPLLVGGSHGANTILRHEADFPGRARAALLIAPGGNALRRPPYAKFALLRLQLWKAMRHGQDGVIAFCAGGGKGKPAPDPHLVAALRTHNYASLCVALRNIPDQRAVDPAALPGFTLPTHVMAWDGDPVIHPIETAREIARLVPGATFEQMAATEGLSIAQIAELADDLVGRWADTVLTGTAG